MNQPKEDSMTLFFSHGLMNANMFDTIFIYISMKFMELICLRYMFAW